MDKDSPKNGFLNSQSASPGVVSGSLGKVIQNASLKNKTEVSALYEPEFKRANPTEKEMEDVKEEVLEENLSFGSVVAYVQNKFEMAKDGRRYTDLRLLECYRNFRGLYGPDVQFTDTEKSRAFIKITKTKVLGAYSKVSEVLFSGSKFPIGIEATPVPSKNAAEYVHFDLKAPKEKPEDKKEDLLGGGEGSESEDKDVFLDPSFMTRPELARSVWDKLGPLKGVLAKAKDKVDLKKGPGKTPTASTFSPVQEAARNMEKKIHDQLEEADADKALRSFTHELCLFGTGVIKGPIGRRKEYPKWEKDGTYNPEIKMVPDVTSPSYWNIYPDPDARNPEDMEFLIERHRLSRSQMKKLKNRPYFRKESVDLAIEYSPNYIDEDWEQILQSDTVNDSGASSTRYEVLEYWGTIDKEIAEEDLEFELPESMQDLDEIQVNIWVCNNQILRFVLNPFTPARIPYYICPYEVNPYSIFGIGVAENMLDTQLIMNGFFRLAIDNAVLSSNVVFEVDETFLSPDQDFTLYPGKIFRRMAGNPGQAIFSHKYPNVTQECLLLFDKARQLSDEATGLPSYAHGMSGIMSTGRTASGMSMLMKAADENTKSVIRNIDDYLLMPLGKALFAFNMQFDFDESISGDLAVVAKGTESLMRNEIRSQRLLQFLQITGNQLDAPFVKRDYILRELAESLDLDPDMIVNDPREASLQAAMMKDLNEAMGNVPPEQGGKGSAKGGLNLGMQAKTPSGGASNPAGAPSINDSTGGTGGGNAMPANPQTPGGEGFSGNVPS